jgi:hypothetical protein
MPRACTICTHPDREAIDCALVAGEANTKLSSIFAVSEQALRRHKESHLPEKLLKAREAEEITEADKLKGELELVKEDVQRLRLKAEEEGDFRTALMGCDRALKALELQAKLLQLIQDAPTVNVLISPEWLSLRTCIIRALEPHETAKLAVLRALERSGNGRA